MHQIMSDWLDMQIARPVAGPRERTSDEVIRPVVASNHDEFGVDEETTASACVACACCVVGRSDVAPWQMQPWPDSESE